MKGAVFPVLDAVLCSGLYSVPFTDVRVCVCWCAHMRAGVCACTCGCLFAPLSAECVIQGAGKRGVGVGWVTRFGFQLVVSTPLAGCAVLLLFVRTTLENVQSSTIDFVVLLFCVYWCFSKNTCSVC